ncbi:hypothetical protein Tco_1502711 [Tanacetum coccineum]
MANIRTCNKHNMIACVEKTEHNADFHQIIDYLTGCSINYSLLVNPDLIGPWLQQFWATASLRSINEVPHIRAMVAGKRVLILEETIQLNLLLRCWLIGVELIRSKEAHSEVLIQGLKFSKGCARTPTQSACSASIPSKMSLTHPGGDETFGSNAFKNIRKESQEQKHISKQNNSQAKGQIKKLSKGVKPLVKHHILWVKSQKLKKRGKKQKKIVSSVKLGRNKNEGNLSEEHHDQDNHNHTAFVYEDLGILKNWNLRGFIKYYARQKCLFTPRTLNFDDEAGPSSPIRPTQEEESKEQFKDDEFLADIPLNISRPKGLSIPGPIRQPSKKLKLRTETIDELRNYLRIVDFEKSAQIRVTENAISMIKNQDYYKHIPPTGLGLILLGDLTTIWEMSATSDDDFWKNQEDWEIIRWRLNESSGVHTLELEDGTMLHMLAERRYPLSRELMIRMLDHGMEVEDESETAITLIHLFILWTTEDGDDS